VAANSSGAIAESGPMLISERRPPTAIAPAMNNTGMTHSAPLSLSRRCSKELSAPEPPRGERNATFNLLFYFCSHWGLSVPNTPSVVVDSWGWIRDATAMITGHVSAVRLPAVTRLAAWSWLCRREECWKDAEILLLRHQLAVLRRQPRARPKPSLGGPGADRGAARCDPARPPGQPADDRVPDTVLRWHRDIVRRRWATRSRAKRHGRPGDPP